jgi:hypothetical protein
MAKKAAAARPTGLAYSTLDRAHEFYNRELFGGSLPPAVITYQRHARAFGYFSGGRMYHVGGEEDVHIDEIAMNPMHFAERSLERTLSTLAHEMAHQWQKHHGKEPSRCYHDKEWANKMDSIGLVPSSTAAPGGKRTGPKVSHYIQEGGPFAKATAKFLKDNDVALYQDRARALTEAAAAARSGKEGGEGGEGKTKKKSKGRVKFQCEGCKLNAWAKPSAQLRCVECDVTLTCMEDESDG